MSRAVSPGAGEPYGLARVVPGLARVQGHGVPPPPATAD